jgi:hypothetical protein
MSAMLNTTSVDILYLGTPVPGIPEGVPASIKILKTESSLVCGHHCELCSIYQTSSIIQFEASTYRRRLKRQVRGCYKLCVLVVVVQCDKEERLKFTKRTSYNQ